MPIKARPMHITQISSGKIPNKVVGPINMFPKKFRRNPIFIKV